MNYYAMKRYVYLLNNKQTMKEIRTEFDILFNSCLYALLNKNKIFVLTISNKKEKFYDKRFH